MVCLRTRALCALLISLTGSTAFAAERIQVSRFAASGSYSSALTYGYNRTDKSAGHFYGENRVGTIKRSEGCPSLLQSLQRFPLQKMVEVGYLTADQAKAYANLGSDLHPTQMTFYTKVDTEAASNLGHTFDDGFAQDAVGNGKILASLYSVSSFKTDPLTNTQTHTLLPIELEPRWKPVLQAHLPPEKRIFLWEFGRAAQDGAGEIDDLLRAATLGCLNDLSANAWVRRANFDQLVAHGNVLIHAKDRAHIIAYTRRHPTALILRHPLDPNDAVFIIPILDMVDKYKPEKLSPTLTKLIDASDGKMTAAQAMNTFNFLKRHRWEELDIAFPGVKTRPTHPIVFSPISSGSLQASGITNALLHEFGVPEESVPAVMGAFSRIEHNLFVNSPGKYVDVTDPRITGQFYKPRKAQEISNLDPAEIRKNPYYVASVLTSVYRHFTDLRIGKFDTGYSEGAAKAALLIDAAFEKNGIRFGITTLDPVASQVIRALGPSEVIEHQNGTLRHPFEFDPDLQFLARDIGKTYYMHFFTIEDIHRLGNILGRIPGYNGATGIAGSQGWQLFYDLANPEFF